MHVVPECLSLATSSSRLQKCRNSRIEEACSGDSLLMVEQSPPRSLDLFLPLPSPNLIAPLEDSFFEETSQMVEDLIIAEM